MIKHITTLAIFTLVGATATTVQAANAFITWDDAAGGSPYAVGDTFTTEGVDVEVDGFNANGNPTAGPLTVGANPFGTSPGTDPVAYPNNANLDLDFAGSIGAQQSLSIQLTENGGFVNLLINGAQADLPQSQNSFALFNAMTINNVAISYFDLSGIGPGRGRLDLTANSGFSIGRVVIGGQEAVFDVFRGVEVPEPATAIVMLTFVGASLLRRRR